MQAASTMQMIQPKNQQLPMLEGVLDVVLPVSV
jgi:hypothetical protein